MKGAFEVSELKVIYLGPACQEQGDGREWCQDDVWQPCECGHTSVKFVASNELDRVTAERDALQQRLNAADQRIDELGQSKELLREAYNEASPRLPYRIRQKIEQFFDGLVVSMSQDAEAAPIKGMIAARGGEYAIMIDENNGHYGWTFRKDSNGMWVSGRKATDAEMQAARQYARHTNQQ